LHKYQGSKIFIFHTFSTAGKALQYSTLDIGILLYFQGQQICRGIGELCKYFIQSVHSNEFH